MSLIKQFKINIIPTSAFAIISIFLKNELCTLAFFMFLFVQELYFASNKKFLNIFFQSLLLIPIVSLCTYNKIPLLNLYNVFGLVLLLVFDKSSLKIKHSLPIIIWITIDIICTALNFNNITDIYSIISFPLFYISLLYGVFFHYYIKKIDILECLSYAFIIGTFLSGMYGFVNRLKIGGISYALINTSIMFRNSGASGDPNYFGLYLCLSISLILFYIFYRKKFVFLNIILCLILLLFGLSSSSRMYYILIGFILVYSILHFVIYLFFRKKLFTIFLIFLLLIGIFYTIKNIIIQNFDYLLSRFLDEDISNGRNNLANSYLDTFANNINIFIFGSGIPKYNLRTGIRTYAHNFYIEILFTQGIVRSIVLIFLIIKNLIPNFRFLFKYNSLPILVMLVAGFALSFIEVDSFYILFSIIISYFRLFNDNISKDLKG